MPIFGYLLQFDEIIISLETLLFVSCQHIGALLTHLATIEPVSLS